GLTHCIQCKQCDKGANLMTEEACTYTKNTVCDCRPDHFCTSLGPEECELCQPHTVCRPGTVVKERCNKSKDNVCEDCPSGTTSTANMSETCIPRPRQEEQNPSPALLVPVILGVLVVVAATVTWITWKRRKRKRQSYVPLVQESERKKHGQALMPTEVRGDQTAIPMQEVGAGPEETGTE
ncbi:TNR14 factor, partial [Pitta sordida]|nr:TNR14 factor [Pitta sordida]